MRKLLCLLALSYGVSANCAMHTNNFDTVSYDPCAIQRVSPESLALGAPGHVHFKDFARLCISTSGDDDEFSDPGSPKLNYADQKLRTSKSCSKNLASAGKTKQIRRSRSCEDFIESRKSQPNVLFKKSTYFTFSWDDFSKVENNLRWSRCLAQSTILSRLCSFLKINQQSLPSRLIDLLKKRQTIAPASLLDYFGIEQSLAPQMNSLLETYKSTFRLDTINCLILRHGRDSNKDDVHTANASCPEVQISDSDLRAIRAFARKRGCAWFASESTRNKVTLAKIFNTQPDLVVTNEGFNEVSFPKSLVKGGLSKTKASMNSVICKMLQNPNFKPVDENVESLDDVVFRFFGTLLEIGEDFSNIAVIANLGTMNCLLRFYDPNMRNPRLLDYLNGFVIKIIPSLRLTTICTENGKPLIVSPLDLGDVVKYFGRG